MWVSLLPWVGWLLVVVMAVRLAQLEIRRRHAAGGEQDSPAAPDRDRSDEEST